MQQLAKRERAHSRGSNNTKGQGRVGVIDVRLLLLHGGVKTPEDRGNRREGAK